MPKQVKELSALTVSRLNKEGTHAVGGVSGLYLQIMGGSKSWLLRAVVAGKRRKMGLGAYPSVSLAQARELARAARAQINSGLDPIEERAAAVRALAIERAKAITFAKACDMYIAAKEAEWRNLKHRQQWENTLSTYAHPVIGQLSVGDVGQGHILKILEPIWRIKTETATRLRSRIESVIDWAIVRGFRDGDNPARWRGHLDKLLPRPSKIAKAKHQPAVAYKDMPQVIERLIKTAATSAQALQFLILTAARTGEVLGAQWSEIDFKERLWTVPAERMKAGKVHRVPLSAQAVALLETIPRFVGCQYIFASKRNSKLSNMAMVATMRRLDIQTASGDVAVPHGFRSSFRDWAADCAHVPGEVAEMALAHTVKNKVEAAYMRSDMLHKRIALMQAWADYCYSGISF